MMPRSTGSRPCRPTTTRRSRATTRSRPTADDLCFESFESYVGAAYEESELDFNYYVPTEDSWAAGDRVVTCVLLDYDGEQLTEPCRVRGDSAAIHRPVSGVVDVEHLAQRLVHGPGGARPLLQQHHVPGADVERRVAADLDGGPTHRTTNISSASTSVTTPGVISQIPREEPAGSTTARPSGWSVSPPPRRRGRVGRPRAGPRRRVGAGSSGHCGGAVPDRVPTVTPVGGELDSCRA